MLMREVLGKIVSVRPEPVVTAESLRTHPGHETHPQIANLGTARS